MRIGIDCRTMLDETAREKAGVAHYTYYLVKNLLQQNRENEYVLFFEDRVNPALLRFVAEWGKKVSIQKFRFSQYKRYLPYVYSHLFLANQIQKAKLDVFHSPANIVPLGLLNPLFHLPLPEGEKERGWFSPFLRGRKRGGRPKLVTTIHDLAIYRHPEWFARSAGIQPRLAWFPPLRDQWFSTRLLVPKTIQQVDHLIAPSQATANDIVELFHVSPEKITIIPHGVEEQFFQSVKRKAKSVKEQNLQLTTYNLPTKSYILFVGTLEPRKNLVRLIEAYAGLPEDILAKYDLVLAGQRGWKYQDILLKIRNLKLEIRSKIKFLGYFPGQSLPQLMQNAAIFVYPSLYEGFGLPVLEAMAAGVPVVTSNVSSLPEIVTPSFTSSPLVGEERWGGEGTKGNSDRCALLVNPYSVEEIRDAIAKLIRDSAYSAEMVAKARRHAWEFSWTKTAQKTLQVYQKLVA